MSESRSLEVIEVLMHLSGTLRDKYLLGAADIPEDVAIERIADKDLPEGWSTFSPREQVATKRLGDAWLPGRDRQFCPSPFVILGERNYVLNPAHADFARIGACLA